METYKSLLKQKGLKATGQRALILKAIEKAGHIDIDSLKDEIRLVSPNISLNTIYLNLEQLTTEEVISKVALNNQKSVYEIRKEAHAHLVCKVCGVVEDEQIGEDILTAMKEGAAHSLFSPSFVAVNIYGVCKNCLENQKNKENR